MKTFFAVVVSLLVILLVANIIAWMMPILTHPIATLLFIGVFVLFAVRLVKASQR